MKRIKLVAIFICLAFPSFSKVLNDIIRPCDSIDYTLMRKPLFGLEFPPEEKWEEYNKRKKKFTSLLAHFIIEKLVDELVYVSDTVTIGFVVNSRGLVDTTYQVKPTYVPFENILHFIKEYDFKNQLVEFYSESLDRYSFLVRLDIWIDREHSQLIIDFERIRKWKENNQLK